MYEKLKFKSQADRSLTFIRSVVIFQELEFISLAWMTDRYFSPVVVPWAKSTLWTFFEILHVSIINRDLRDTTHKIDAEDLNSHTQLN